MKILFADDDPMTLDSLDACAAQEGFTTLLARNGRQALDLWRLHLPDLLYLNIKMPDVDGYEVLPTGTRQGSGGAVALSLGEKRGN